MCNKSCTMIYPNRKYKISTSSTRGAAGHQTQLMSLCALQVSYLHHNYHGDSDRQYHDGDHCEPRSCYLSGV